MRQVVCVAVIFVKPLSRVVSEIILNKFQLKELQTEYLEELRESIKQELARRRKQGAVSQRRNFITSLHPKQSDDNAQFSARVKKFNSSNLLALRSINDPASVRCRYLPHLVLQDWSHIYSGGDNEEKYYVYVHVDPREHIFISSEEAGGNFGGRPFYVGKGCGNRAYDLKRNQGHGKIIKSVLDEGYEPNDIVKIVFSELSEAKAFELEAKLIYFFGTIYQSDRMNGWLYNLDIPLLPEFNGVMEKLLSRKQFESKKDVANNDNDQS